MRNGIPLFRAHLKSLLISQGGYTLIDPQKDIAYLGAFRFPTDTQGDSIRGWNYREGDIVHYPLGDPDRVDGDSEFLGSIYATGHTYDQMAAEFSIPTPSTSRDYSELPIAKTLQHFKRIKPDNATTSTYGYVGLAYIPEQQKFYSTFYHWYNVAFSKMATHGSFEPGLSAYYGAWWVGSKADLKTPPYDTYAKFMGTIPESWANQYTPNQLLLSGGERAGSAPDGPRLVAIQAWNDNGSIPAAEAELPYTVLLQHNSDHPFNSYIENDYFTGVAWLSLGAKSAVMLSGQKAYGEYFYGYRDGSTPRDHIDSVPPSKHDYGGGKGGAARSYRGMLIFYKPEDFANVAQGTMETWEPQPYAVLAIEEYLIKENPGDARGRQGVESVTYDMHRGHLYVVEPSVSSGASDVIHVFRICISL